MKVPRPAAIRRPERIWIEVLIPWTLFGGCGSSVVDDGVEDEGAAICSVGGKGRREGEGGERQEGGRGSGRAGRR